MIQSQYHQESESVTYKFKGIPVTPRGSHTRIPRGRRGGTKVGTSVHVYALVRAAASRQLVVGHNWAPQVPSHRSPLHSQFVKQALHTFHNAVRRPYDEFPAPGTVPDDTDEVAFLFCDSLR